MTYREVLTFKVIFDILGLISTIFITRLPWWLNDKESACNEGDLCSIPGLGRPQRREWQPIPVFLPREFHGQKSLANYSPWSHKQLDMTNTQIHYSFLFVALILCS